MDRQRERHMATARLIGDRNRRDLSNLSSLAGHRILGVEDESVFWVRGFVCFALVLEFDGLVELLAGLLSFSFFSLVWLVLPTNCQRFIPSGISALRFPCSQRNAPNRTRCMDQGLRAISGLTEGYCT